MNFVSRCVLINLCCVSTLYAALATSDAGSQASQQTSSNTSDLVKYTLNLGAYLCFYLKQSPTKNNQKVSQSLLNPSVVELIENYALNTFLGAIPVNAFSAASSQFLPSSVAGSSIFNDMANATFNFQKYSSPSSDGKASVSVLIDQKTYQPDPVSQAVLNILGTPDYSFCMSYDGSTWNKNCNLMHQNQVMSNVVGPLPSTTQFFTYDYNQQLINQLNSNSLTGPLLYSTENTNQNTGSAVPNQQNPGLTAQNQVEAAANFIRYATGAVAPANLPQMAAYDTLYNQAVPPSGSTNIDLVQQMKAQSTLASYLTSLRIYAAQSSVGAGNLYYILSKRLPQNQSADNSIQMSQAMSEFKMATWRLFNPDLSKNNQWTKQLDTASSATVQKEIATLLAEISYQMYLDRQIQERILLTNSIMLIQNTRAGQPNTDFSAQGTTSNSK